MSTAARPVGLLQPAVPATKLCVVGGVVYSRRGPGEGLADRRWLRGACGVAAGGGGSGCGEWPCEFPCGVSGCASGVCALSFSGGDGRTWQSAGGVVADGVWAGAVPDRLWPAVVDGGGW